MRQVPIPRPQTQAENEQWAAERAEANRNGWPMTRSQAEAVVEMFPRWQISQRRAAKRVLRHADTVK